MGLHVKAVAYLPGQSCVIGDLLLDLWCLWHPLGGEILIYVIFRATLHECLSVSKFRSSQAEGFLSYFFYHLAATAVVTNFSDLYRGRYFVFYSRLVVLIFTHK
jgi:hypothetical protein